MRYNGALLFGTFEFLQTEFDAARFGGTRDLGLSAVIQYQF
ncbi:MAG: hypothetical protein ABR545_02850 [Cyclonatronaceae bacterium]